MTKMTNAFHSPVRAPFFGVGLTNTLASGLMGNLITGTAAANSLLLNGSVTGGAAAQRDIVLRTGNAVNPQALATRMTIGSNAATPDIDITAANLDMNGNILRDTLSITGSGAADSFTLYGAVTGGAPAQRDLVLSTGDNVNPQATVERLRIRSNAATPDIDINNANLDVNSNQIKNAVQIIGANVASSMVLDGYFTSGAPAQGDIVIRTGDNVNPQNPVTRLTIASNAATPDIDIGTANLDMNANLLKSAAVTSNAGAYNWGLSGSTGTFSTPTNTFTHNGAVSLAANIGITSVAGTGAYDFSAASGIFKTSTGAATFGGTSNTFTNGLTTPSATGTAAADSLTIYGAVTGGAPLQRDLVFSTGNAVNPQATVERLRIGSNSATPDIDINNSNLDLNSNNINTVAGLNGYANASSLTIAGAITGGAPLQRDLVFATGNAVNPQALVNRMILTSNAATADVDILNAELDMNANVGGSGTIKRVATLSGAANASSILIQGETTVAPAQRDVVIQTGNAANPMVATTRLTFTSNAATGQIDMTNADFDLNSNKIIVDGGSEAIQWKAGGTGVSVLDFTDVLRPTRSDTTDAQFIDDFFGAAVNAHTWRATGTTAQLADPLGGWVQIGNVGAGTSKIDFNDVYATAKANNPAFECRFKLGTTPNRTDVIGLIGSIAASTADASLEGAAFRHTEAGAGVTNWFAVTKAAGVSTSTDTTIAADTSTHTFRIETTDGGTNWKFYIDGTLRATNNTNTPTTSLQPAAEVTVTSGTPFTNIDFTKLWTVRS